MGRNPRYVVWVMGLPGVARSPQDVAEGSLQDAQWATCQEIFRWEMASHRLPSGSTWKHTKKRGIYLSSLPCYGQRVRLQLTLVPIKKPLSAPSFLLFLPTSALVRGQTWWVPSWRQRCKNMETRQRERGHLLCVPGTGQMGQERSVSLKYIQSCN